MSKVFAGILSSGAIVLALAMSSATPGHAQGVFDVCADDLEEYCSAVTPGDGRLSACLYAHEDKISESCASEIDMVADRLDLFFESIRFAFQQCADDISEHCQDVAIGGGRIHACLKDNSGSLTDACAAVVKEFEQPEE